MATRCWLPTVGGAAFLDRQFVVSWMDSEEPAQGELAEMRRRYREQMQRQMNFGRDL